MAATAGDKNSAARAPEDARAAASARRSFSRGPAAEVGLKEALAATNLARGGAGWSRLEAFLAEPEVGAALRIWLGVAAERASTPNRDAILARLSADVARLDALLSEQVNAILHHPRFQQLEASWRGLQYLTEQAYGAELVKIRMLNISWSEVSRDIERAIEFDQSQLFAKIYNEEFGTPGGEPFGVLLGDYSVRHRPDANHRVDDITVLQGLSHIAAAAFAPAIVGTDPAFFGLDDFTELGLPLNLPSTFQQVEYTRWQSFRDTEDARFLGLTLPRVLMRIPYADDGSRSDRFRFEERVEGPDNSRYLWGNAVYAYGAILTRAFSESGWLANIQGVERGSDSGGLLQRSIQLLTARRGDGTKVRGRSGGRPCAGPDSRNLGAHAGRQTPESVHLSKDGEHGDSRWRGDPHSAPANESRLGVRAGRGHRKAREPGLRG